MVDEHDLLNDDEFLLVYLSIGNSCSFNINKERKRRAYSKSQRIITKQNVF